MANFDMDWGQIKEVGTGGNVDFLKLQPGENRMRIVGKPSLIEIHWEKGLDGQTKKVICVGSGCPICKAGHAPQRRYQIKVIDRTDAVVKILEGGATVFNAIRAYAMDPDYGDPTRYDIKIKKEGSGRETKYTVVASPKQSDLTDEEARKVDESKSLAEINKPKSIEEIMQMGLEVLSDSLMDLGAEDDMGDFGDDDWEGL